MIRSILPLSLLFSLNLLACGEKETEDLSDYCGEDSANNLIAEDGDCDGILTADDCDDADAESSIVAEDGDCDGTITADDCDDADPESTIVAEDGDCDGAITDEDCDDADAESLTTAEDGDCDGVETDEDCDDNDASSTVVSEDGDCDGTLTDDDCDDNDASSTIVAEDGDCDGTLSAEDCDDSDPNSTIVAEDADCDTYLIADDCDDTNPNANPASGTNEAMQISGVCYSDADADGYGDSEVFSGTVTMECYLLEMIDGFGDGWSGNEIEIFEDGLSTGVYANTSSVDANESQWEQHCLLPGTSGVTFVFNSGLFSSDMSFFLHYDNGVGGELILSGEGTTSSEFTVYETTTASGEIFYSEATPLPSIDVYGTDCDDTDAVINPGLDADSDGFSTCDDCDDSDADINPDAEDEWFDGIDSDCAGNSDYDYDGDGYDSSEYSGTCSDTTYTNQWDCEESGSCSDTSYTNIEDCEDNVETWTWNTWTPTGTDCDDDDELIHPLVNEADPTACYEDYDDDGWGSNDPWDEALAAGTDCYDYADYMYPGAAYNEPDVDGDGVIDCTEDRDGDGWGYPAANSFYGTSAGTDCDDEDDALAPDVDIDGDGIDSCNDCDDEDAALQGGFGYWDDDADGYGDIEETAYLMCDLTVDDNGDGVPDYSTTNDDCDDGDEDINPGIDSDADGADACHDCDDEDGSVIGLEAYPDGDGDGWGSGDAEWVCDIDTDGDGVNEYSTSDGDCYDDSWSSIAPYVYPGAAYNELDIDGDGVTDCTEDGDGDGWGNDYSWYADVDGTDCDDDDGDLNQNDVDGDGYATCPDVNELIDCDDDDGTTFPGAGFNEANFDSTDYSTYECLTDGDGDGYAYGELDSCYTFALEDTWGDGWNGGMNIEVFEDGVSIGTATVGINSADGGSSESTTLCVSDGAVVEFVFNEGSYAEEIAGEILGTDGSSLGALSGSGASAANTQELIFGGISYYDGEVFYTETAVANLVGGTDSNDSDPAVH